MNEVMDQLSQVVEARGMQIRKQADEENRQAYQEEAKAYIMHMERILQSLPDEEREWLDEQLMKRLDIPEQERLRYYKAGLADAIEVMRYLRT